MARRDQLPDSISYNGPTAAQLTALRNKIDAGDVVYAADIQTLIGWINSWDNHTHTYTDMYQTATFGNNGDRETYTETKVTTKHDEDSLDVQSSFTSTGDLIRASKHNLMRDAVNRLRSHKHTITDRTSS